MSKIIALMNGYSLVIVRYSTRAANDFINGSISIGVELARTKTPTREYHERIQTKPQMTW